MYYKACTKHFPVLLCITNIAQTRSQYYCVLQSLHKYVPSTTVYYKHCTNTFPVLLGTAKLAESRSQYYCVLQTLHRHVPSTTVYYKACTNTFPVPLRTTKLAQTRSQYYCVLQSLHKVVPSTTLYNKVRTKSFLVLLCTTKLAPKHFPILLCLITVYCLKITCAIPSTGELAFPFLQRPFGGIPLHTPILGTLNKHMHREPQPLHATALRGEPNRRSSFRRTPGILPCTAPLFGLGATIPVYQLWWFPAA